jgi:2-keto-4-pentenoate hydratase/2-oxohepta-3-ene-1,7-dioic acid hydratase in catechol pathway
VKLASFQANGKERLGLHVDGWLADLATVDAGLPNPQPLPCTMLDLIEAGPAGLDWLHRAAQAAGTEGAGVARFRLDEVTWRAPVRRPSKICCIALNNSANSDRILTGPDHPAMFVKPASTLIGHLESIECRAEFGRTHPEPELAVVIGRTAKNIAATEAYDYVFGYTIHNDITSPTMRGEDTFHYRAIHPKGGDPTQVEYVDTWVSYPGRYKCSDTFACMGPWLVTRDEIPDPHELNVSCAHLDKVVTEDNTRNLTHKTPELLAFLTRFMTLLPGDIVSLGTALQKSTGGGAVQNIDLNRLGGPVSVTIERIGSLTNGVKWVG